MPLAPSQSVMMMMILHNWYKLVLHLRPTRIQYFAVILNINTVTKRSCCYMMSESSLNFSSFYIILILPSLSIKTYLALTLLILSSNRTRVQCPTHVTSTYVLCNYIQLCHFFKLSLVSVSYLVSASVLVLHITKHINYNYYIMHRYK